jgi:hypothetical protein
MDQACIVEPVSIEGDEPVIVGEAAIKDHESFQARSAACGQPGSRVRAAFGHESVAEPAWKPVSQPQVVM